MIVFDTCVIIGTSYTQIVMNVCNVRSHLAMGQLNWRMACASKLI